MSHESQRAVWLLQAIKGSLLDLRDWLQRVGVTLYCNVFLGCAVPAHGCA